MRSLTRQRLQQRRATEKEQASRHTRHRLLHAAAAVHCLPRTTAHPRWCRCHAQEAGTAADGSSDDAGGSIENSSRAVAKAPVDPVRAAARVAEEAQVAQGQRTAVITGAVSIIFGVRQLHCVPQHSGGCQLNSSAVTLWVAALHSAWFGQCISVQKACTYHSVSLYEQPAPTGSPQVAYEIWVWVSQG